VRGEGPRFRHAGEGQVKVRARCPRVSRLGLRVLGLGVIGEARGRCSLGLYHN